MILLEHASTYDTALYGEPFLVAARRRLLDTRDPFWTVGEWEIVLPERKPRRAPEIQRMVLELKTWTTWSSRRLAEVFGTSHTTVRAIESGRPLVAGHSGDLRRRVIATHDVVSRIAANAGHNPTVVRGALESASADQQSARDALQSGEPAVALLRALDHLRPRPAGLLVGEGSRRDGATAALHE
jgi:hypothetical protein